MRRIFLIYVTDKNKMISNNSILMERTSRGNIAIVLLIARTKIRFWRIDIMYWLSKSNLCSSICRVITDYRSINKEIEKLNIWFSQEAMNYLRNLVDVAYWFWKGRLWYVKYFSCQIRKIYFVFCSLTWNNKTGKCFGLNYLHLKNKHVFQAFQVFY